MEDAASNADSSKNVPADIASTPARAILHSPSAEPTAPYSHKTLSTVGNVTIRVASMVRGAKILSVFVCRGPRRARESALTPARTATTAMGVAKCVLLDSYVLTECVHDTCLSLGFTNCFMMVVFCCIFETFSSILVFIADTDINT